MSRVKIIILAKAPIANFSKTRLIPDLGEECTAVLARKLFYHTIKEAIDADIGPVELCVTPSYNDPLWLRFCIDKAIKVTDQIEGSLSEKLIDISKRAANEIVPFIIIGTDCPALDSTKLREVASCLNNNNVCIVPACDGGYVLIGLNQHHDSIFTDIPWSSNKVFSITLKRVTNLCWSSVCFDALHDIDIVDDLKFLPPKFMS
ncbi:TIGR04282 family arsenosugar biosynthesis glycosyltransferase [Vibrio harveyi]|uniref:TIGR04282 family arsenosugar biosynthesis glycosyltransferase n=1 Tax=Vibrio harveyi TaxID=669 RepID=UPI00237FE9BE|nr:TIGR04282 family arsenosugar biosynthesis glycosyltransferase [Vibrio harveyi]